ncbi:AlpA family transcriptional regulator [Bradyrhizobium sp. RT3b]|uniref:helix-turn-helix transcriptional regulator n=1 Tax=Bradyrhizobium sp. RT3b TaxID=3156334 RepID=UPI0033947CCF
MHLHQTLSQTSSQAIAIDPLLRLPQVLAATGLSTSSIYRKIAASEFPRPLKLGRNSVCWRTSEVVDWIDALTHH